MTKRRQNSIDENIIKDAKESLKDDPEIQAARVELDELLKLRYLVQEPLGKGGAGIVFRISDIASGIDRVAKILRKSVREYSDISGEFKKEAKRISALRHPNLVTVFEQSRDEEPAPYFIMELIKGNSLDRSVIELVKKYPNGRWVKELRNIAIQLADVLAYLHSQKPLPLLHLDIKPENIIVSTNYRNKSIPILLDFGISRDATEHLSVAGDTPLRGTYPMWPKSYMSQILRMTDPNRTLFSIHRSDINASLDLHLLGRTLEIGMDIAQRRDSKIDDWQPLEVSEFQFVRSMAERLDIDNSAPPFDSSSELRKTLKRLDLPSSRTRYYVDPGFVKIPGSNVRSFGKQARALTDWPKFQRMRGIHQLGFTYLVYPGAVHSRFEHSLGVFENAISVLDELTSPSGDFQFRSVVADEELVGTALVALLHDIGHYPFAHQFRISGKFPRHEDRTCEVLQSDEVASIVKKHFNDDVYQALLGIMRSINASENPEATESNVVPDPAHYSVLRAIVSSSIDVDKLDYVKRDSLHCGVPYGQIVDRARFLSSLRVWWDVEGSPKLLLSDKGRACAEGLVFARYLMTSEVYWNHAVRSYSAMLSAAIDKFDVKEINEHLWDTDNDFLKWLAGNPRGKWFTDLIDCRTPYRRAFVHQRLGSGQTDDETDTKLFELLEKAAAGKKELLARIRKTVIDTLSIRGAKTHEIVLDIPEGMTRISGVKVLAEGHEEPGRAGPIFDAIGANFDGFARKARIFVHPRLIAKRSVAESTSAVRKALIKEFKLT